MARELLVTLSIMSRGYAACATPGDDDAVELARLLEPDADEDILPTQVTARRPPQVSSLGAMRSDLASLPEVNFHYVVAQQPRIAPPPSAPHHVEHLTPYGFQIAAPPPMPSSPNLRAELSIVKRELAGIVQTLTDPRSPTSVSNLYDRASASWRLWEWNASDIAWAALLGTLVFALAAGIGVGIVGRSEHDRTATSAASLSQEDARGASDRRPAAGRVPRAVDQHTGRAPIRVRAKRR